MGTFMLYGLRPFDVYVVLLTLFCIIEHMSNFHLCLHQLVIGTFRIYCLRLFVIVYKHACYVCGVLVTLPCT